MIDKSDNSDKLNGCFFFLNNSLILSTNGENNSDNSPFDFIGNNRKKHSTCYGYDGNNLSWFQINTSYNYILPKSYYLHGRNGKIQVNNLKSWVFEGFSLRKNAWKRLHIETNRTLEYDQEMSIKINSKEAYNSYRIRQIGVNSSGNGWICLSQIEVFGYIYPYPYYNDLCHSCKRKESTFSMKLYLLIIEISR